MPQNLKKNTVFDQWKGLLTKDLFDLIDECSQHSNRFIRESSFYILSAVLDETLNSHPELIEAFAALIYKGSLLKFWTSESVENYRWKSIWKKKILRKPKKGLSDNWSQVRMASSNSCRSFLFALDEEKRKAFYSLLLPPIALNRYYIAAGVRIHNQG